MKKLLLLLTAVALPTFTFAQFGDDSLSIPVVNYSAINISQDNADALAVGAHPGDMIRFEVLVTSDNNIESYSPRADLSRLTSGLAITDAGIGNVQQQEIVFPTIENAPAPFSEKFVFFGRVNQECGGLTSLDTQALDGNVLSIALNNCDQTGGEGSCYGPNGCGEALTKTGPNMIATIAAILMTILAFGVVLRKKQA